MTAQDERRSAHEAGHHSVGRRRAAGGVSFVFVASLIECDVTYRRVQVRRPRISAHRARAKHFTQLIVIEQDAFAQQH